MLVLIEMYYSSFTSPVSIVAPLAAFVYFVLYPRIAGCAKCILALLAAVESSPCAERQQVWALTTRQLSARHDLVILQTYQSTEHEEKISLGASDRKMRSALMINRSEAKATQH